jgi:hypothetical protein
MLIPLAALSLAGCATTRPVAVVAPCPPLPVPPPALLVPPQSPATAEALTKLLKPT